MLINRVVVNTSPLICLFKSGLAELFPALFKDVAVPEAGDVVRGTYLSYLRNLIFDEHVFIQLKEKRTVSRFYFYKRVGPDFAGETFRVLKEKKESNTADTAPAGRFWKRGPGGS